MHQNNPKSYCPRFAREHLHQTSEAANWSETSPYYPDILIHDRLQNRQKFNFHNVASTPRYQKLKRQDAREDGPVLHRAGESGPRIGVSRRAAARNSSEPMEFEKWQYHLDASSAGPSRTDTRQRKDAHSLTYIPTQMYPRPPSHCLYLYLLYLFFYT